MTAGRAIEDPKVGYDRLRRLQTHQVRPSPENDRLYRPIDCADPDFVALVDSVREHGVKEPIVVTLDGWIVSGHRRHAAACQAQLTIIPCRIEPIRRNDNIDSFVNLLREYNRQRVKTLDEQVREEAVSYDPEEAYQALVAHRREKSDLPDSHEGAVLMGAIKRRKAISANKRPFLDAVIKIIEARRKFWPLSDRQVHYALLNDAPLRHAKKLNSRYANDRRSYHDLTDILTRARLAGLVGWDALADETRKFTSWNVAREPGVFIRRQLDDFLKHYFRDLQQSQPNHIEIMAEKLTVKTMIEAVASDYCIPVTIGRGFCSIDPRRRLAERFRRSGREKLIVLMLSDFDPDGEVIASSYARSMRDDFGIDDVVPIKVAITGEQVQEYHLPPSMEAKKSSSNHAKFVERHGTHAYELEALQPETLQQILRDAIDRVIDVAAFNAEIDAEKQDAVRLGAVRATVARLLGEQNLAGDSE